MEDFLYALTAGLVSAGATQWLVFHFDQRKARRGADHLALRLADEFDSFAERCMSTILANRSDYDEYKTPDRLSTSLPAAPELFTDHPGWESLDRPVAAEILSFPRSIEFAAGHVSSEFMYGSPATAWCVRDDQAAKLGAIALDIAKRLREDHNQHAAEPAWDYHERLVEEGKRLDREQLTYQKKLEEQPQSDSAR